MGRRYLNISQVIEKYLGKDIKKEKFVEYSPSAMKFVNEIANFIFKNNGGLLMIDYGFTSGKMKNTLQSVERHRKISFLENPYNSDITHLINFNACLISFIISFGSSSPICILIICSSFFIYVNCLLPSAWCV